MFVGTVDFLVVLLAFNRCCDFCFSQIAKTIFHKNRTYIWIVTMYLYAVVVFVLEPPVTLNTRAIMWLFDAFMIFPPDVLPVDHMVFIPYMSFYNIILLGFMVLSYVVFLIALAIKGCGGLVLIIFNRSIRLEVKTVLRKTSTTPTKIVRIVPPVPLEGS
uniref:G protein-coupled receptor n=1 Tax=Steinernema glaseri TaxID=37863 RepID=A0A1I8ASQ4_9BILA